MVNGAGVREHEMGPNERCGDVGEKCTIRTVPEMSSFVMFKK
jgi:hypothetical protein